MSRVIMGLAFVWQVAIGGACARSGAGPGPAPVLSEDTQAAVRGAVEQWRQAHEVRSVDALAKVYAQDAALVVVQQGEVTRGWTDRAAQLGAKFEEFKEVRVRVHDLAISPLGDAGAAATARVTSEVSNGITTVTEDGTLTLALRRRADGGWEIVSQHYSYPVR